MLRTQTKAKSSGGTNADSEGGRSRRRPALGAGRIGRTGKAPAERGEREAPKHEPALGEARQTEAGTEPLLDYLLGQ